MGMTFSEWAEQQRAQQTPAQAELHRRFAAEWQRKLAEINARQAAEPGQDDEGPES